MLYSSTIQHAEVEEYVGDALLGGQVSYGSSTNGFAATPFLNQDWWG
jgi:hypothetical protein